MEADPGTSRRSCVKCQAGGTVWSNADVNPPPAPPLLHGEARGSVSAARCYSAEFLRAPGVRGSPGSTPGPASPLGSTSGTPHLQQWRARDPQGPGLLQPLEELGSGCRLARRQVEVGFRWVPQLCHGGSHKSLSPGAELAGAVRVMKCPNEALAPSPHWPHSLGRHTLVFL